jgi:signal transduction histidine kinase
MIFRSIRWRVQAWHGLILFLVLSGFGFTAYRVAWDNQMRRTDRELEQQLTFAFRPSPPPGERHGPPPSSSQPHEGHEPGMERIDPHNEGPEFRRRMREWIQKGVLSNSGQTNCFYFVVWDDEGTQVARSAGAPEQVPPPKAAEGNATRTLRADTPNGPRKFGPGPGMATIWRTRGEFREAFRFMPFSDCALVGRSITPDLVSMETLVLWLVIAGTGVLALGLAGGWWVSSRAIRPIAEISAAAVKIAGGDLSQRINAEDTESEFGRLTEVLNSTFARLEAAFAHQARFTSDASHELRTPVSVILSQTQTALSRERSSPEYRQALEACERAAQRMRRLTESLMELARLDAGQEVMKHERFDLGRIGRECVELIHPLADERGVKIDCELPPVECLGDSERISQVITNLLNNAIHFNRAKGNVRISCSAGAGTATLKITDTGQGIPPEHLPHIFERFYQVDKSRSRTQGRSGLGLAISKAIIHAHNGTIEATSELGVGSAFVVNLPQ